tara:strand:- start:219 stop:737 length:519 start_codon:yes stop_codon:yes gene_type:complete
MTYRPSFESSSFGTGRLLSAVFPAGICAALSGMVLAFLIGVIFFSEACIEYLDSPLDFFAALFVIPISLGLFLILATFSCAFYIFVFGLPVAWILGDRIHEPVSWFIILPITLLSTIQACFWSLGLKYSNFPNDPSELDLLVIAMAFGFALPAAYFYRRYLIAFRDEEELLD